MANTKITTNVIADDAVTSDKLGGDLTMPGHVSLADSKEIRVGTGNDLVIKHDGSHTTLTNTTGNLILAGGTVYIANAANNEYMAQFVADGAASLKFNNVEELATVSGGVYIPNKLGIGTNNPAYEAQITSSDDTVLSVVSGDSNSASLYLGDGVATRGRLTYNNNGDYLAIYTDNNERVRIDSVGRVLIGTENSRLTSGVTPNFVIEGTSYNTNSIGVFTNANGVLDCPAMFFGKSRGTSDGSNTVVQNGDRLFSMRIDGSDGTNLEQAAIIEAHVDAAPAANSIPGRMTFMTTNSGSQYATEKMRIDNTGVIRLKAGTETTGSSAEESFITHDNAGNTSLRIGSNYSNDNAAIRLQNNTTEITIFKKIGVTMPLQPVASYGHTAGSEAGGYAHNFGGTGSVSVICKPQAAIINRGSMYNASNGRFTAPVAGIYRYAVHGNLYTLYLADGAYFMIQIRKNGGHYVYHYEVNEANSSSWLYNNMGGVISMAKDDYLEFRMVTNNLSGGASGGFGWDASSYTHYEFQLLY